MLRRMRAEIHIIDVFFLDGPMGFGRPNRDRMIEVLERRIAVGIFGEYSSRSGNPIVTIYHPTFFSV